MTSPRVPRPALSGTVRPQLAKRPVYRVFQESLRALIRGLPQTSRLTHGVHQTTALRHVVKGGVGADPCWMLDQVITDLLARARTREEACQVRCIAHHLDLEIQARIAADLRWRYDAPIDVHAASVREQRTGGALDVVQVEAGATPSVGLLHRLRAAAMRHAQALGDLLRAIDHQLATGPTPPRRW